MQIRLDKYICADFLAQWVTDMKVEIVTSGCAGSKIKLAPVKREEAIQGWLIEGEIDKWIRSWCREEFVSQLDGTQIARANGKLYLVGKNIQSRCGCGTSFSFEKKVISQDLAKIHRLRSVLQTIETIQNWQKSRDA